MKKLVVYVNKADMVDDPEMLELVRPRFHAAFPNLAEVSHKESRNLIPNPNLNLP